MPHPLRFESKKGANLCSVSLEPRNWLMVSNIPFGSYQPEWKDYLKTYSSIFGWNFRKVTLPFTFHPEIPKFSVRWQAPLSSSLGYCRMSHAARRGARRFAVFGCHDTSLRKHPFLTKAEEGLPTSDFQLPTSNFGLPTSNFRLRTSNFAGEVSRETFPAAREERGETDVFAGRPWI